MADELARLRAVEQAIKDELAEPGNVTKSELREALAAQPPAAPTSPPGDFDDLDFALADFN